MLRLIRWSGAYLQEKGVSRGRLDAELLLAHVLAAGRLELYLQHDRPLTPGELAAFRALLLRRARREPLQYVLGRTAFRELELSTDPRVLIPRPETEALVEAVLRWARGRGAPPLTALDVGTGSGAVALSLALEGPFALVVATDPSGGALEVARGNAQSAGLAARVEFRRGSLFGPLAPEERFDVVVSNPPYVASQEAPGLEPEVRDWEPPDALFAGPEGLDVLVPLVREAARHLRHDGLLALEIGPDQRDAVVREIRATNAFEEPRVLRDLAQRERIVLAERGPV